MVEPTFEHDDTRGSSSYLDGASGLEALDLVLGQRVQSGSHSLHVLAQLFTKHLPVRHKGHGAEFILIGRQLQVHGVHFL